MSLLPFRPNLQEENSRRWLALMSAALVCLFVACLVAEEVDAQRKGFGGGGYRPPFRGGFGRGLNGGYGGFRQTPRFTPPPARRGGGFGRRSTAPPPMMPRQPIPRSGGFAPQPRPLPKPVSPKPPVTSLKGFSGQTTKAGSPIVQTSQGKRFAVPQKGISTSLNRSLLKTAGIGSTRNVPAQHRERLAGVSLGPTFQKAAIPLKKYSPITDPGPLHRDIASTFRSATYSELVLRKPKILYRTYSDDGKELGSFWSTRKGKGLGAAMGSAIDSKWGNKATKTVKIVVPAGTRIYVGWAAPQVDFTKSARIASDGASSGYLHGSLVGGGRQVYIEKVDSSWVRNQ